MNHYEPNTSLNLSLSPGKRQMLNLGLGFDAPTANSSSRSPPPSPLRVFSCNYCRRKFYSSEALGGHQNAHKLERTLAKKSREFSSAVQPHSSPIRVSEPVFVGRFEKRDVIGYGSRAYIDDCEGQHVRVRDQDEISQLDLSLRL
ncbi:zinc finger protein 2-like [Salvia divinorum]|uniref:Zinc finger protein 2-like n=1 Tax=Salvia divinorum TaxID=28513 RepID=A0ABD1I7G7_SALDI